MLKNMLNLEHLADVHLKCKLPFRFLNTPGSWLFRDLLTVAITITFCGIGLQPPAYVKDFRGNTGKYHAEKKCCKTGVMKIVKFVK